MTDATLPLSPGRWTILMRNSSGEWVQVGTAKDQATAIRKYNRQPNGYEYRLYNPAGKCVTSRGFH